MKLYRGSGFWKFRPFQSCSYAFDFTDDEVPCWFHRTMQRLLLGFRWEKR